MTELTRTLRALLESTVGRVWVEGEISNYRKQSSGHQYFTLKDDRSQLPCVLFSSHRGAPATVVAPLADGQCVQAFGQVTVYEARGQYQMIVEIVQPRGLGALQARFEALKRKLQAEGLFEQARKQRLPAFPARVGLVTSPTGAALQDMLNVLRRRAPWVNILIYPVRVQGQGAAREIADAVAAFNTGTAVARRRVDLIVLARGGGSIEDLFEFNEEVLARAIAASDLPVVSAVGHEIDFTIADFVADVRAPTPSAAAELIVPDKLELTKKLDGVSQALGRRLSGLLESTRKRLATMNRGVLERQIRRYTADSRQRLDAAEERLRRSPLSGISLLRSGWRDTAHRLQRHSPAVGLISAQHELTTARNALATLLDAQVSAAAARLKHVTSVLRVLGPQGTLERGYSITLRPDGSLLTGVSQVQAGQRIVTRLRDGQVNSTVTK